MNEYDRAVIAIGSVVGALYVLGLMVCIVASIKP
jgi:hypothetical protein